MMQAGTAVRKLNCDKHGGANDYIPTPEMQPRVSTHIKFGLQLHNIFGGKCQLYFPRKGSQARNDEKCQCLSACAYA